MPALDINIHHELTLISKAYLSNVKFRDLFNQKFAGNVSFQKRVKFYIGQLSQIDIKKYGIFNKIELSPNNLYWLFFTVSQDIKNINTEGEEDVEEKISLEKFTKEDDSRKMDSLEQFLSQHPAEVKTEPLPPSPPAQTIPTIPKPTFNATPFQAALKRASLGRGLEGLSNGAASRAIGGLGRLAVGTGLSFGNLFLWSALAAILIGLLGFLFMQLLQSGSPLTDQLMGLEKSAPAVPVIGAGCPDTSSNRDPNSCRYLNPSIGLFDTDISQVAIDAYAVKYKDIFINGGKGDLNEFNKRVNYIVDSAKNTGLNPALFLGYWKSESLFSTVGIGDMGCMGDNFYEQVDCALGIKSFSDPVKNPIANCAKSKDANSPACKSLKSNRQIFDQTHPVNYPIATIDDFAEAYGPYDHLTSGQPTNCTHTYNILIEVSKELEMCRPSTSIPLSAASCPIPGGKIGCASYGKKESWDGFSGVCRPDSRGIGGHCNANYIRAVDICQRPIGEGGNLIRTAKSIDLSANSKAGDPVYLPTLGGKLLQWKYQGVVSAGSNFGWIRLFKSVNTNEGEWSLHLVHVNQNDPLLNVGDIIESGTVGATILKPWIPGDNWPHVHVTIGLNVGDSTSDLKDYSPNWKFADRDLSMCIN